MAFPEQADAIATEIAPPRRVLIVDRDRDVRAMYRMMLDGYRFNIDESEDGAEALGKALCSAPDVVVADVRLVRIDGVALCQLLRSAPTTRSTVIVLITGDGSRAEEARARSAGAAAVLVKPFTVEALTAAVTNGG